MMVEAGALNSDPAGVEPAVSRNDVESESTTTAKGAVSAEAGRPGELWLRRGDQLFVGTLVIAALGLMGIAGLRFSGWGRALIEIDRRPERKYDYQLDINTAPWIEWTLLEGIGETLAKRIVDDRTSRGPFQSVDDLRRVKGIGQKTLEQMRPWLTVGLPP